MTAALEGGEWSAARPGRTLPPGKTRYPFYRRLGGPQGRSGRTENLVPTGIRDRPARSQSLYRLSYPALTHTHTHTHVYVYVLEESDANAGSHYEGSSGNRKECCVLGLSGRGPVAGFVATVLNTIQYVHHSIQFITGTKSFFRR